MGKWGERRESSPSRGGREGGIISKKEKNTGRREGDFSGRRTARSEEGNRETGELKIVGCT